ncbi:MAG: hypothetical protein JWM20_722 [Patescibacteria group bacterium]|nr:hypothetical protein [Patescibacteria group bacterium]
MKIILCHYRPHYLQALADKIKHRDSSSQIPFAPNVEEALEYIPDEGPCILVTENCIPSETNETGEPGVMILAKKAKEKNPDCKTILYTADFHLIDASQFDVCINSFKEGAYDKVFAQVMQFSKN